MRREGYVREWTIHIRSSQGLTSTGCVVRDRGSGGREPGQVRGLQDERVGDTRHQVTSHIGGLVARDGLEEGEAMMTTLTDECRGVGVSCNHCRIPTTLVGSNVH